MTEVFLVNSLYFNLERLMAVQGAPGAAWRLGLRWSFGLPDLDAADLPEWTLPLHIRPLPALLESRGSVCLRCGDAEDDGLDAHLDAGGVAVVAVDSHELPYRPAYGRVHSGRTVIVRGPRDNDSAVLVEDCWPPAWRGRLKWSDLEAARTSAVPLDPRLEPLFAGVPAARRWWTVEVGPIKAGARSLLAELVGEALEDQTDPAGRFGLPALEALADRFSGTGGPPEWRARRCICLSKALETGQRNRVVIACADRAAKVDHGRQVSGQGE